MNRSVGCGIMGSQTNLSLSIGTYLFSPYTILCKGFPKCLKPGIAVEFTRGVCKILKADCVIHEPRPTNTIGSQWPNGSWSGVLGDIETRRFDTYVPTITPTSARMESFKFSELAYQMYSAFLFRAPPRENKSWLRLVFPLKTEICIGIFLSIFIVGSLSAWFEVNFQRINRAVRVYPEKRQRHAIVMWMHSLIDAGNLALNHESEVLGAAKLATRLVVAVWALCVIALVGLREAFLIADVLGTERELPFKNSEGLIKCLRSMECKLLMDRNGSSTYERLRDSKHQMDIELRDILRINDVHIEPDYKKMIQLIQEEKRFFYVYWGYETAILDIAQDNCNYYIVKDGRDPETIQFAFGNDVSEKFMDKIDKASRHMHEFGVSDLIESKYVVQRLCERPETLHDLEKRPFDIKAFFGPLIIMGFGFIAALSMLGVEIVIVSFLRNWNSRLLTHTKSDSAPDRPRSAFKKPQSTEAKLALLRQLMSDFRQKKHELAKLTDQLQSLVLDMESTLKLKPNRIMETHLNEYVAQDVMWSELFMNK